MGFAWCIRRSASSLVSLYTRVHNAKAVSAVTNSSSLLPISSLTRPLVSRTFLYSTVTERLNSDQTLLQVINSEIKFSCAVEDNDDVIEEPTSNGFPFKIEDNRGHRTVTLTRDYNGEKIRVEVSMPGLATDENEDDIDEDNDDGDKEKSNDSSIPLVVTVTKKSGLSLEFSCSAFPDEITLDGLTVHQPENSSDEDQLAYEGPEIQDLDESMRKSFHKFLENRGIKVSTTNFLYEYMMRKESKEYLLWLKNLKNFIQD